MATAIQRRRGNTAQHASFTGLAGEITIDTDKNTVVVHDGSTAGGHPLAKASEVQALGGADITAVIAGSGLTGGASSGNATISLNYENLAGNLVPSTNNTFSLGTVSKVWKDVYVGPGSLYVNGQQVLSDNSGTITVSADSNQNLSLVTTGTGDLELTAGGEIQLKSNIVLSAGKTITASGGLKLASNIDANSQYINNLTNPVNAQDAATKHYVDNDSTVVRTTGTQVIAGEKTFSNNIIVSGNLTVSGTTTTVNSETISLADNIIDLNSNFTTGSPTENAGIRIKRGDSSDVLVRWDETDDKWQFTNDGSAYQNMLTDAAARALISVTDSGGDGSLSYNSSTGVITYTGPSASDVRAHFSAGTGLSYSSGQFSISNTSVSAGVYGNGSSVSQVTVNAQGQITSASNVSISISSGQVSDFATAARSNISVTDAGGDGSMSYDSSTGIITYTGPSQSEANSRIDAYLSGGAGLTYTSGVLAVGEGTGITVNADNVAVNSSYITSLFSASDAGGDGSFSYSNGVFTYTGPSQAEANTRIDARLSGGTGITYTSGVIATTITQYTDSLARAAISVTDSGGDGSLSYNSSTGVITYTGPSASDVRAHFSAGTGVTLSSGQISIGQAVGTSDNVSFNNVTATANFFGNLTGNVTGNATGNAGTATKLATERTIALTGDVTGSATFDGSANATITATIAANSVVLGTDTTGNYVASVANGNYITGGSAGSEGATLTLAVDATTTATASKVAARDASGDLYANIFQGTASSARYADLAERYEADAILEPGTVVCFGGEKEITACDHENDHAVAGVVSTDPAYMMNSAAGNNDTHPYIALTGRVPVKVVGPVAKGDLLVASGVKGHAMANNNAKAGTIIGKAIGSIDSGEGVVEALINLM